MRNISLNLSLQRDKTGLGRHEKICTDRESQCAALGHVGQSIFECPNSYQMIKNLPTNSTRLLTFTSTVGQIGCLKKAECVLSLPLINIVWDYFSIIESREVTLLTTTEFLD